MRRFGGAILAGVLSAVVMALIMTPALRAEVAPMPATLGLAVARRLFGQDATQWHGFAMHVVYLAGWTVVYVAAFSDNLSFARAFAIALFMWVLVQIVFYPVVGWGFLGLAVSPLLIPASLIVHLLWAFVIWILCRIFVRSTG
jgi:hypothetical protein